MGMIYLDGIPFEPNNEKGDVHLECDWDLVLADDLYEDELLQTLCKNAIDVERYEVASKIQKYFKDKE